MREDLEKAAKRRQNAAHGASRGLSTNRQPSGAKDRCDAVFPRAEIRGSSFTTAITGRQLKNPRIQSALRWSAAVLVLLPAVLPMPASASPGPGPTPQFAAAQQMQETLEGRPLESSHPPDYERVINAYRRVYLEAPTSGRADPSVVAAAQMTEEMGRRFNDPDILRSAIQQYEFLRREYPGSKFRFDALFRIGEIYKDDLHDKTRADATFEEFLHRYPRNQFADAARQALAEPAQSQASLRSKAPIKTASKESTASKPISDADKDDKNKDAPAELDQRKTTNEAEGPAGTTTASPPGPWNPSLVHA